MPKEEGAPRGAFCVFAMNEPELPVLRLAQLRCWPSRARKASSGTGLLNR